MHFWRQTVKQNLEIYFTIPPNFSHFEPSVQKVGQRCRMAINASFYVFFKDIFIQLLPSKSPQNCQFSLCPFLKFSLLHNLISTKRLSSFSQICGSKRICRHRRWREWRRQRRRLNCAAILAATIQKTAILSSDPIQRDLEKRLFGLPPPPKVQGVGGLSVPTHIGTCIGGFNITDSKSTKYSHHNFISRNRFSSSQQVVVLFGRCRTLFGWCRTLDATRWHCSHVHKMNIMHSFSFSVS